MIFSYDPTNFERVIKEFPARSFKELRDACDDERAGRKKLAEHKHFLIFLEALEKLQDARDPRTLLKKISRGLRALLPNPENIYELRSKGWCAFYRIDDSCCYGLAVTRDPATFDEQASAIYAALTETEARK